MHLHAQREALETISRAFEAATTDHHRAILHNYRVHTALEQGGRWNEMLDDDEMFVPEPHYVFQFYGDTTVADGRGEVDSLYSRMAHIVQCLSDEQIAVADWGFASFSTLLLFARGHDLQARGVEVDDAGAMYVERSPLGMFWHYTEDAVLIGERAYQLEPASYEKIDESDAMTKETQVQDCNDFLASLTPVAH
jgi:hypothetical protein